MYDLSKEFKEFYYNEVVLSSEETSNLREKKRLNIERLKSGLEEYNAENSTNYKIVETLEQGSIAMSTVTQNEANDYDIDVAIVFDKDNLNGLGSIAVKNVIVDALNRKCTNFKTPPEAKTNCVRIVYADNYHIDFAIYRREKKDDIIYTYEHAGSIWRDRDPRAINNWFKDEIKANGEKLRQAIRLSKMFCKSRTSWRMPGGLIQTVLCDEKIQSYSRMDEMFYYTMKEVKNRLYVNKEVYNPTDTSQSLLLTQDDKTKVENYYNRLDEKLNQLDVLFISDCTEKQAKDAWKSFFNHDFWNTEEVVEESSKNVAYVKQSSINELIYDDTEEFIENIMPVNLKYSVELECKVTQNGWQTQLLRTLLRNKQPLRRNKKLDFYIAYTDAPKPYDIYWKVRNRGPVAIERNMIRGQIIKTNSDHKKEESNFRGPHYVECYIVKNNVCVGIGRIDVPISDF